MQSQRLHECDWCNLTSDRCSIHICPHRTLRSEKRHEVLFPNQVFATGGWLKWPLLDLIKCLQLSIKTRGEVRGVNNGMKLLLLFLSLLSASIIYQCFRRSTQMSDQLRCNSIFAQYSTIYFFKKRPRRMLKNFLLFLIASQSGKKESLRSRCLMSLCLNEGMLD